MQAPAMFEPREIAPDLFILPAAAPLPGAGVLAVNAFLIRGREPMLIDAGFPPLRAAFLGALTRLIDPGDLTRIFLTHIDADHTGAYADIAALAPKARTLTTFLGQAKLGLNGLPADRVELIAPGDVIDLGDRRLIVMRPPYFDAPETVCLFDERAEALMSADSYGALTEAPAERAEEINARALGDGLAAWAAIDAPWLALTDPARLGGALAAMARRNPRHLLSSHLPPMAGMGAMNALVQAAVAAQQERALAA